MDKNYKICVLNEEFYKRFSKSEYPEILRKESRPYAMAIFQFTEQKNVAVPFRTNLGKNNGFKLSGGSGLDFSKLVIIDKYSAYLGRDIRVRLDENRKFRTNIKKINDKLEKYIQNYCNHITGEKILHPREFERQYKYATLQYFHKELGLQKL